MPFRISLCNFYAPYSLMTAYSLEDRSGRFSRSIIHKVVPSLELVINPQQVILQIWLSTFEKVINHQQVILQMWLSAF